MNKYYNKEIPTEIHVVYGGRYTGKTYYEFKKIKWENERLKEENMELREEIKFLKKEYNLIMKLSGSAANYILDNCVDEESGRISNPDILKIFKILSNGGEPVVRKESEE